jgi:hypothetical protein
MRGGLWKPPLIFLPGARGPKTLTVIEAPHSDGRVAPPERGSPRRFRRPDAEDAPDLPARRPGRAPWRRVRGPQVPAGGQHDRLLAQEKEGRGLHTDRGGRNPASGVALRAQLSLNRSSHQHRVPPGLIALCPRQLSLLFFIRLDFRYAC